MSEERLTMTITEAARYLGISRGLAYEMARQNRLPIIKYGRRQLIPRKPFFELMERPGSDLRPLNQNGGTAGD